MFEELENVENIKVEYSKDLKKFSTMRLKASGNLITVSSVEALCEVQKYLYEKSLSPKILGMGANQLLEEVETSPYLKITLPFDKTYLNEARESYTLPASITLSILSSHAIKFGLTGWESFTGIPATLGGAIFMNAGTNLGEIGPLVKKVRFVTCKGEKKELTIDENSFSYRKNNFLSTGDVVYEVELIHFGIDEQISKKIREYLELRNKSQPLKEWTCGCVFKNSSHDAVTCRAGKFIDIMGLKGFSNGEVRISPKHANFMENSGEATYSEVTELIKMVQNELKLQFGVDFETEVKI